MKWSVSKAIGKIGKADILILGVAVKDDAPDLKPWSDLDRDRKSAIKALADSDIFTAKAGQIQLLAHGAGRMMLMGLGDAEKLDLDGLRNAVAAAAAEARRVKAAGCLLGLPWKSLGEFTAGAVARTCVEGAEMQLFDSGLAKAKTAAKGPVLPRSWKLVPAAGAAAEVRKGIETGQAMAGGTLFTRELVDQPANIMDPARLVAEARKMARREGITAQIHGESWLRANGMGGVLGVGQGSRKESRLIRLDYKPRGLSKKAPSITLVGKGVTFDSGGISLKPGANMHEMKGDMGGAAAVLGAALIVARLRLPVHLRVIVPVVENMPGGNAIRPGDVLKMASGKTVEVLNTDAEGRLILGDALHLGSRDKPDYMIDAATLTGACCIALGDHFAGLFGNETVLADAIYEAGGDTFERVWRMPLLEAHHKAIESQVADIKNLGGKDAGASTAAAFLEEFVPETQAWAHLDIAGPAWSETAHLPGGKGASGYGARLLARTVAILAGER